MSAWIGIAGTIVGVLLAGWITWLNSRFQLHRQEDRDRKKLFLTKLEELYEIVAQVKQSYTMSTASQATTLAARQPVDMSNVPPLPVEKLQMLVGFYAPDLEFKLEQLALRREEFGAVLVRRIGLERKDQRAASDFMRDLADKALILNQTCNEIQREIISLSKKYI